MAATTADLIEVTHSLEDARRRLTRRGGFGNAELSPTAAAKLAEVFGAEIAARDAVDRIVSDVAADGDAAVRRYTAAFDGATPPKFEVPCSEWQTAWNELNAGLRDAMEVAAAQIKAFHEQQRRTHWVTTTDFGIFGQLIRPLERIGIYTPGGSAAYPSSLLMTAVPARVAGVDEIVVCAPPGRDGFVSPLILAAAHLTQVDRLFAMGGAQAIAAMAYGTETVPHVDKIFGPGNIFVALAKQRVFGVVALDQIAGPTETLLIADDSADPALVAADLLAQAEHDPMASAILLTTSGNLPEVVASELGRQLTGLPRASIAAAALRTNGLIAVVPTFADAVELANSYAPEHLCLLVREPWALVPSIRHAGGIFVGEESPEALGDYTAGPSHVMPTGGTARSSSPIHLGEFLKSISVIAANRNAVTTLGPTTIALAEAEGLSAHAQAIERRLRQNET
ncbi:MAG: histidinol dehydrogenase [Chloroflexota bacterium]|nr:histidinol dehydrogenase [Chloroflexota bacterium]